MILWVMQWRKIFATVIKYHSCTVLLTTCWMCLFRKMTWSIIILLRARLALSGNIINICEWILSAMEFRMWTWSLTLYIDVDHRLIPMWCINVTILQTHSICITWFLTSIPKLNKNSYISVLHMMKRRNCAHKSVLFFESSSFILGFASTNVI